MRKMLVQSVQFFVGVAAVVLLAGCESATDARHADVTPAAIGAIGGHVVTDRSVAFPIEVVLLDGCQQYSHVTVSDSAGAKVVRAYQVNPVRDADCGMVLRIVEASATVAFSSAGRYRVLFASGERFEEVVVDVP